MAFRIVRSGIAGAVAWWVGFQLFFMSAQGILADPERQSAKFIAVFAQLPPLPHTAISPWPLPIGMAVLSMIQATVFAVVRTALPVNLFLRGLTFGAIAWALCFPWFEFYLPWNVMNEPVMLVCLELALWAAMMALVGVTISLAFWRDRSAVSLR
jgi:hypothetical protein